MTRPPSSIVGTTPLGFMSRYHFWSLPPNAMPTSTRSYVSPHSSAHHSTFMTLIELTRPQIFIPLSQKSSVRCGPVEADAGVDDQWHRERRGALHDLAGQGLGLVDLLVGHLEQQFVVHLQQHAGLEPGGRECRRDADHGALDDVGGTALQRRIDRGALG